MTWFIEKDPFGHTRTFTESEFRNVQGTDAIRGLGILGMIAVYLTCVISGLWGWWWFIHWSDMFILLRIVAGIPVGAGISLVCSTVVFCIFNNRD